MRIGIMLASVGVACITLTAGLWPFAFHVRNEASWSVAPSGLRFSGLATAMGDSPFNGTDVCANKDSPFTLELWVQAETTSGYGTILAFDSQEHSENLSIRQSIGDIELVRSFRSAMGRTELRHAYVDDVLSGYQPKFLTMTVDGRETWIYVDGKRMRRIRDLGVRCADLQGTLIMGTAAASNDTWDGTVLGLAAYDRALRPEEVWSHYEAWTAKHPADLKPLLNADALYLFNEGVGRIARNAVSSRGNIAIPENYAIRRKRFLQPFWEEFSWDRLGAIDIAVNIVGFVPLGFCVAAFVGFVLRRRQYFALSVALCLAASLTIEVIQFYIPTRYSGTLDLITNTCGGALGASLFGVVARRFLRKPAE